MTTDYDRSRVRAIALEWCTLCERWFHRPTHDCAAWVRPVDRKVLCDGQPD